MVGAPGLEPGARRPLCATSGGLAGVAFDSSMLLMAGVRCDNTCADTNWFSLRLPTRISA
jgi:hypothetical protein